MDYFLITLSAVCVAAQFTFNKLYQKNIVKSTGELLLFPLITGVIATLLFLCLNGFSVAYSSFSVILAAAEALILFSSMLCGIFVVKWGRVSVYTVFMMLGGMFLPYLYGVIFLNESIGVFEIVGMIVLIAGLFLSVIPDKNEKTEKPKPLFYVFCVAIFCLNGGVSIVSKVHQIGAEAVLTQDFMIWLYAFQLALALICFLVYLLFFRKKNAVAADAEGESAAGFTLSKRILLLALGIGAGYALVSGAGYLLQLNAAKTLPATMLYPFITGGSILFSTFAARIFFKEKINLYTWISLALMLCGTILFIF